MGQKGQKRVRVKISKQALRKSLPLSGIKEKNEPD
jgi:hypothetical protein